MQWPQLNYQAFITQYPQFAEISEPIMNQLYIQIQPMAQPIIGLLRDTVNQQPQYVNVALAHICDVTITQQPGRLTTANTQSITANIDLDDKNFMASWWQQTQFGQQIWQILRTWRMFNGGARFYGGYNPNIMGRRGY
jgi:hypothetical protein